MRQRLYISAIAVLCGVLCSEAIAGPAPEPGWFSNSIANADLVVLVSIGGYVPDKSEPQTKPKFFTDARGLVEMWTVRESGTYDFKKLRSLKGDCGAELKLKMPLVSAFYYGNMTFDIPVGGCMMLFLKKEKDGNYVPVDPLMPMIPVSAEAVAPVLDVSTRPKTSDSIDVVLASLADAKLLPVLAHVVQDVVDERAVVAVWKYADDQDLRVRSNVLYCLARNEDLRAIPRIAAMADEIEKRHAGGSAPLNALQFYKKAQAVPLLNPLIINGNEFIRLNAMIALRPIADQSSVPFLMQALDKDDSQHTVAYGAYYTLHQLIGRSIPPALSRPQFLAQDEEIQILKQWWEWEQVKAKKAAATQTAPTQPATQPTSANP